MPNKQKVSENTQESKECVMRIVMRAFIQAGEFFVVGDMYNFVISCFLVRGAVAKGTCQNLFKAMLRK